MFILNEVVNSPLKIMLPQIANTMLDKIAMRSSIKIRISKPPTATGAKKPISDKSIC